MSYAPVDALLTKGGNDDDDDDDFAADAERWQSRFNLTRVSPHIFLGGGITSGKMIRALVRLGVTDILCVAAEECDRDYALVYDMGRKKRPDLYCIYLPDLVGGVAAAPPTPEDLVALYRHWRSDVARALYDDCGWPVWYIHCHSGVHRAPIATAFLLAAITGQDFDGWLTHLSALRPEIAPYQAPLLLAAARRALTLIQPGAE